MKRFRKIEFISFLLSVVFLEIVYSVETKIQPLDATPQNLVTIIFTNSANGYMESCNCPSNPNGGLIRRATAVKEERKNNPDLLLIDSGDNFLPYPNKVANKYVLKIMKTMNYDVMGLGDQEFILGPEYIKQEIDKNELPFVSANIKISNGSAEIVFTPAYIIKQVGNYKVGIVSILSPKTFLLFPKDKITDLKVEDPIPVIKKFVADFRKKVDLIILVSHSGYDEDKNIAKAVNGVDLIIGGHSQTLIEKPTKMGNTLIVQAGEKGSNVGKLNLSFDKKKKIVSYQYQVIPLTKDVPDDKEVRELINQYNEVVQEDSKKILIEK